MGGRAVMQVEDMVLISVDDHIVEPPSMSEFIRDHVPARFKDRAPRVVRRDDGSDAWLIEGQEIRTFGLNAVAGPPQGGLGQRPRHVRARATRNLRRARAGPRHERQRRADQPELLLVARARRSVLRDEF